MDRCVYAIILEIMKFFVFKGRSQLGFECLTWEKKEMTCLAIDRGLHHRKLELDWIRKTANGFLL